MADLAVGRVAAIAAARRSSSSRSACAATRSRSCWACRPSPSLQERRDRLGQPFCMSTIGAVLVEGQRLDLALEDFSASMAASPLVVAWHHCLKR